ncbi:MAG: hypothetical protein OMM_09289 [Candidatus Magnetoglobus multicellularis str. Araruama]|uniref:Uncharacterized protein n=1 Tax=Candidatus Magnetoglobus multicellularis str. Araruama TaxID=890399 RepID=A0A1V1P4T7_9BACT|nr:MAG: hypothetical protein OMM_09289 [Candidatus Magnetoglobus multicellularis str. Araruama]
MNIYFNSKEEKQKIEIDTTGNSQMDTFQYYKHKLLVRLEKDNNHDGKIDLKINYVKGVKQNQQQDTDYDGFFETHQMFNDPQWSVVMTQDFNQDNQADLFYYYTDGKLMQKKWMRILIITLIMLSFIMPEAS